MTGHACSKAVPSSKHLDSRIIASMVEHSDRSSVDASPLELLSEMLDDFGRKLPDATLQGFLRWLTASSPPGAFQIAEFCGYQLQLVLDSCTLQSAMRTQLRHGKSGLLKGIWAGFVRPIAPRQLDRETRKHHKEIALDCGVKLTSVRALYAEILPLIEFRTVRPADVRRLRRELPNPEDAAYVALCLAGDVLGVMTEEKAFSQVPGLRVYSGAAASQIVLCYRKQAVVLLCSAPAFMLAWAMIVQLFRLSKHLLQRRPSETAMVAIGLMALAAIYPDRAKSAIARSRSCAESVWAIAAPHVVAFGTIAQARMVDAADTGAHLRDVVLPPSAT